MFFVAAVTLKFFLPLRADHRWQDRVLIAAGFTAWAALLVHSLVDFNLHIPANAFMLFALTGLALGRIREEEAARHWSTISLARAGRWVGGLVVVLSLAEGVAAGWTGLGDIFYEQAYAQAGEVPYSESINAVKTALAYDRGNAQALMFLGDLYRYQGSRQTAIEDRIADGQKALDAYQLALRANSINDSLIARKGMTFDVMRRYAEAFFCYKQAVEAEPYNGLFWYWLGNHYWERGLPVQAEEAYLLSEACPHGGENSPEAEQELRQLRVMQDVPLPAPGTNPLEAPLEPLAPVEPAEPPTTP